MKTIISDNVLVGDGPARIEGHLHVPQEATGIVLFVHGSGSSRHSPRNRFVAESLRQDELGTLLFDLLTPEEESADRDTGHLRFNIALLAERLTSAAEWIASLEEIRHLPVGYFGASTGAAAALISAAERPKQVRAVVSRGGRPDLAGPALPQVEAPTLLIVGSSDTTVIAMNEEALDSMHCERRMEIVPGASHLFEEPGALEAVARLARRWFKTHLKPAA